MFKNDGEDNINKDFYPEKTTSQLGKLETILKNIVSRINNYRFSRLSTLKAIAQEINKINDDYKKFTDEKLQSEILQLKLDFNSSPLNPKTIKHCFAIIMELIFRAYSIELHMEQIIGSWIIMHGNIAEMSTGEGKTFTAFLPACTAAMQGKSVIVLTVNDYLVQRDAKLLQPLCDQLNLSLSIITEIDEQDDKFKKYESNIVYTTQKILAFDYLRDKTIIKNTATNLQLKFSQLPQEIKNQNQKLFLKGLQFVIVDEVDSILIDEARTPLILAKENNNTGEEQTYKQSQNIAKKLHSPQDFYINESEKKIILNDNGKKLIKDLSRKYKQGIWAGKNRREFMIYLALQANHCYKINIDYLVSDNKIQMLDEFTGRKMENRSWQHGLQQLIELKENCSLTGQKETLARTTYQQLFQKFIHLSGMTGTAMEVRSELLKIYNINIVRVPLHKKSNLLKLSAQLFIDQTGKINTIMKNTIKQHQQGRAVLIGTRSVSDSNYLSLKLRENNLKHCVLNANHNQSES